MNEYVLTVKIKEQIYRFKRIMNEEEFQKYLSMVKGVLPKNFKVIYLKKGEALTNSKKVQALAKFPVLKKTDGRNMEPYEFPL